MTETYTFRYLNADGSFNGIALVQLDDRYSAELSAKNLMPNKAASVEIWRGDDLIGTETNAPIDRKFVKLLYNIQQRVIFFQ